MVVEMCISKAYRRDTRNGFGHWVMGVISIEKKIKEVAMYGF
jgi:hypothetical protein